METKQKEEENRKKLAEVPHNVLSHTETEGEADSCELEATSEAEQQTELNRTTQLSKNTSVGEQLKVFQETDFCHFC